MAYHEKQNHDPRNDGEHGNKGEDKVLFLSAHEEWEIISESASRSSDNFQ